MGIVSKTLSIPIMNISFRNGHTSTTLKLGPIPENKVSISSLRSGTEGAKVGLPSFSNSTPIPRIPESKIFLTVACTLWLSSLFFLSV